MSQEVEFTIGDGIAEETMELSEQFVDFGDSIKSICGVDVNLCFQCAKCAGGCPVSYAMDYTPTQLVHAIQLGLTDLVMSSKTMWLCLSCQTCTTRCPQDVDLASVMDAVRIIAQRNDIKATEAGIHSFHRISLRNIRFFGRMYELGLIGLLKLSTWTLTKDLGIGFRMLWKRKLNIFPRFRGARSIRRIFSQVEDREKV